MIGSILLHDSVVKYLNKTHRHRSQRLVSTLYDFREASIFQRTHGWNLGTLTMTARPVSLESLSSLG